MIVLWNLVATRWLTTSFTCLPHAHILLTLKDQDVPRTPKEIDDIVSAEIPDKDINPELHDLVKKFMLHGPCVGYNLRSPCLDNKGKICEKHFPKPYLEGTTLSENGVITYRRRQPEKIPERIPEEYSRTVTGVKVRGQQTDVILNNHKILSIGVEKGSLMEKMLYPSMRIRF